MMAERRGCINEPDYFCYICRQFTLMSRRRGITQLVKYAYNAYFGMKLGDQDKKWAPHIICSTCNKNLTQWLKGKGKMQFAVPMTWREPLDHTTDCYFCLTYVKPESVFLPTLHIILTWTYEKLCQSSQARWRRIWLFKTAVSKNHGC